MHFFPLLVDHPGVKTSHCHAAIGIMAVKKTRNGVFLYFGHNTDSFVSSADLVRVSIQNILINYYAGVGIHERERQETRLCDVTKHGQWQYRSGRAGRKV